MEALSNSRPSLFVPRLHFDRLDRLDIDILPWKAFHIIHKMKMPQSQTNVGSSFKRSESGLAKRSDVRRVMCRNRKTANKILRTPSIILLTFMTSSFSCCCFGFDGWVGFI